MVTDTYMDIDTFLSNLISPLWMIPLTRDWKIEEINTNTAIVTC
jgi:hypothetical protein